MSRHHKPPWNGPECPWCGDETTSVGKIENPDGGTTWRIYQCHLEHTVRVPEDYEEP